MASKGLLWNVLSQESERESAELSPVACCQSKNSIGNLVDLPAI